jgi:hypothetical protein
MNGQPELKSIKNNVLEADETFWNRVIALAIEQDIDDMGEQYE